MHVSLAANWLFANSTTGVCHDAEEQHSPFKLVYIFPSIHIHRDRIDRVRAGGVGIAKARSNGIKRAIFRLGPNYSRTIAEIQRVFQEFDVYAGIKGRN